MAVVFFPSCKARADYKSASEKLAAYIYEKFGVLPIGCCRVNHQALTLNDTAIVVCNNCAAIIEENTQATVKSVWEVIDEDAAFPFPDYHGENITIQDCRIGYDKRNYQDAVRSLLKKMNFTIIELEENYEKTKFCGVNLLKPCIESNARLAHKRYVEDFPDMFTPMPESEWPAYFRKHCAKIKTERVACYCKFCRDAINMGGKQGVHMLELLFPEE